MDESRFGYGGESRTTNNRMEVWAIIEAMRALPHDLVVVSDSQYALNCGFGTWKRKTNLDVWASWESVFSDREAAGLVTSGEWVKGHSGVRLNEVADRLAYVGQNKIDISRFYKES